MSTVVFFSTLEEGKIQTVVKEMQETREREALTFNAMRGRLEKRKAGEKGLKFTYLTEFPGGHSTPTALQPDYNEPVAPEMIAGYVYPVRYRLPAIFDHAVLRDFKNGSENAFFDLKDLLGKYMEAAGKRMNRAAILDGKGSLAYSTSTITALGSATMNGDTTPAVSAGHTKGTKWLEKNNFYHAINETTGLPRGFFKVTTPGKISCTINLLSGTISSGDVIVDVNTYNGYMRGLAWLVSPANRTIQGVNSANNADFNSNGYDLANATISAASVDDIKTGLQIRNNKAGARNGKVIFIAPGLLGVLRKQGQNLRVYNDGYNIVQGIAESFKAGDSVFVEDSDMDEDRAYFVMYSEFGMLEEMALDVMDIDGQKYHQLMGANNSGSDRYQHAIGWDGNMYRKANAMGSAVLYRASVTGNQRQVDV
jgi:hypothetical protein